MTLHSICTDHQSYGFDAFAFSEAVVSLLNVDYIKFIPEIQLDTGGNA